MKRTLGLLAAAVMLAVGFAACGDQTQRGPVAPEDARPSIVSDSTTIQSDSTSFCKDDGGGTTGSGTCS